MDETDKTPEWMLLLENKKKKPHRLAHEIGAGAPCLTCGDKCPGLDLHFWRKLCRNCKCKKEEHDVRDDEGYEQFEILFANSVTGKKKRTGAFLNIKVPETLKSVPNPFGGSVVGGSNSVGNKSVAFDWVPPDVSEDLAAEYMQQLPSSKLPISGSDGALFRRQQLEIQVPLHDLDASKCHGLTPDEIQGLQQYLENVKNNVVGQGRVTKIPVSVLYAEQRVPYSGPTQSHSITLAHSSVTGECKPIRIATSQSAQSLKSMSSFPIPRPFQPHIHGKNDQDNIPPPLLHDSVSSSANLGLKTPSAFFLSQHSVGHADAQLAIDHQAHYLSSCTAHSSKQDVQYSTKLPGGDVAQTVGSTSSLNSATDEKQFINMPFHAEAPVGQPIQILTHARDGTFVTDQQANEITYSTQMPVGLVSQQSKGLDISREASDHVTGKKHEFPSNSSIEADISDESKQIARDGVITASRHPAGISFSEEMKTKNMQNTERISDPLQTYDPAFQRYSSTVQNPEYGAHSVQGLSDKAVVDISDESKQIARDGVITASRHPAGISFSEEMKTQNMQNAERVSDPLQTYDPAFQHRYSSTVQNPEYGAHSVKELSDKAIVDISDESKQIARDGVITASRHPAGISFSEEMKTQNMQNTERISDPLQTYDPAFQHRYSSTVQNPEYGAHSVQGLSDRARVDISDKSKQIGRDGVITASRHPAGISFSEEMKTQNTQSTERISDPLQTYDPAFQHRYSSTIQNPEYGVHSIKGAEHPSLQQGEVSGTACLQGVSSEQSVHNVADSLSGQQQKSSPYSFPTKNGVHNVPKDSSASEYRNSDPRSLQVGQSGVSPQDATFLPYSTNVVGHIVHSLPIDGDSMPKSAHMMQQSHVAQHEPDQEAVEHELAGKLQQLADLGGGSSHHEVSHLECRRCSKALLAGDVAVFAERAGKQTAWHPQCFVCCTCEELLVDLIYFYHNGEVYCGRHFAQLLNIPRCFACDELIFVKEYTCAEGKAFHVRHFCCYECDIPLGGKQYIPKDDQPVCLECFQDKYGKKCHTCKLKIAAGDPRVGWKELSWHVSPDCFCCFQCSKSLLGGKFLVKNEQPFCSKECYQDAIQI